MRSRAAVLNAMGAALPYAHSRPLSIDDVELDPPGQGEVLVRVAAAGLCHSDLSVINGDRPRPVPTTWSPRARSSTPGPSSSMNKLLTHRIELSAINEGFDRLHEGKAIRQVVTFKS